MTTRRPDTRARQRHSASCVAGLPMMKPPPWKNSMVPRGWGGTYSSAPGKPSTGCGGSAESGNIPVRPGADSYCARNACKPPAPGAPPFGKRRTKRISADITGSIRWPAASMGLPVATPNARPARSPARGQKRGDAALREGA